MTLLSGPEPLAQTPLVVLLMPEDEPLSTVISPKSAEVPPFVMLSDCIPVLEAPE